VRLKYEFDIRFASVQPSVRIKYTCDFDSSSRANAGHTDLVGLTSVIDIDGSDNERLALGLVSTRALTMGSLGIDYRYSTGNSEGNHGIGLRLKSTF